MQTETAPDKVANWWKYYPHTYGAVASGGDWIAYDWLTAVSRYIWPKIQAGGARIIINTGPRQGKSEFASKWLPICFLDQYPDRKIILTSYGKDLAQDYGREIKREIEINDAIGFSLAEDSQAAGRWHVQKRGRRGGMYCVGVDGAVSGKGYHLGLIDDPYKNWDQAWSPAYRAKVEKWFTSTFKARCEPGASIIVLHTRWHAEDLTAYLMAEDPEDWDLISLPALAEPGDPLGRAEGEALCPERFTRDDLLKFKGDPDVFAAVWQQSPKEGGKGRAYHEYTAAKNRTNAVAFAAGFPLDLSFDFNKNPGCHCEIGQYFPAADYFTTVDELFGPRYDITQVMELFGKWWKKHEGAKFEKEIRIFGDRSGKTEDVTTSQTCYRIIERKLNSLGIPFRRMVPRANPPIVSSLADVNDALCDPLGRVHWKIHPRCVRLVADLKELKTDQYGKIDKKEKRLSHPSDAERYRISRLRPIRGDSRLPTGLDSGARFG